MTSLPESQVRINLDADADGGMPAFFRSVISDHAAAELAAHPEARPIIADRLERMLRDRAELLPRLPDLRKRELLTHGFMLTGLSWWKTWKLVFRTAGAPPAYAPDGFCYLETLHRALRWYYAGIERKAVA